MKKRWITLRNKRRVQIDEQGRIVKGVSRDARGVHVRDLVPFMAVERELDSTDCSLASGEYRYQQTRSGAEILRDLRGATIPQRFPNKDVAVEALLVANPSLFNFVQSNWGSDSQNYKHWIMHGRAGLKPQLGPGDGRFDPINVKMNLRGTRRCSSFLEALYLTIPSSHRWEDITPDQLEPLSECVGFVVEPPEESILLPLARQSSVECSTTKKQLHQDLLETARRGRLERTDVPF